MEKKSSKKNIVVFSLASCSEVLLLSPLLGLDGIEDGFPLGLVALADLLYLLFHLRLQRSQALSQLRHSPRAHLQGETHPPNFTEARCV